MVCGEPVRRTVNLLKGLMRGCWLLSRQWLFASVERGRWADEEDFELTDFSPAARVFRREREAFGRSRTAAELLADCPPLYFSPRGCRAPVEELRRLAAMGGARLARVARAAGLVVGEVVSERRRSDAEEDVVCLRETWLFDCLQRQQVLPYQDYLLV